MQLMDFLTVTTVPSTGVPNSHFMTGTVLLPPLVVKAFQIYSTSRLERLSYQL